MNKFNILLYNLIDLYQEIIVTMTTTTATRNIQKLTKLRKKHKAIFTHCWRHTHTHQKKQQNYDLNETKASNRFFIRIEYSFLTLFICHMHCVFLWFFFLFGRLFITFQKSVKGQFFPIGFQFFYRIASHVPEFLWCVITLLS